MWCAYFLKIRRCLIGRNSMFNASDFLVSAGRSPKSQHLTCRLMSESGGCFYGSKKRKTQWGSVVCCRESNRGRTGSPLGPSIGEEDTPKYGSPGEMAKKKSEQIQLEMRHAIDNLVDDISERMQEGMDR